MEYLLKHFDTDLLAFEAEPDTAEPGYNITWVNEPEKHLLPLNLEVTPKGLSKWIKQRTIPKNRAFVIDFLVKCGLDINRPMNIVAACKGLSLTDCYWVTTMDSTDTFDKINLYDNPISNMLASLVFTGYGSSIRTSLISSPEFTTNGMLPKCWRRIRGAIYLYKGGTSGASNAGFEPYSEYYAAQVAKHMEINAVPYGLSMWKNTLCSTCELFTSKDLSFMPVGRIVTEGGMDTVRGYYQSLGDEYVSALDDMILLDSVICNTDRHFGNFGFLVDNYTNTIVSPAPLFDHGNSLFNLVGHAGWKSDAALNKYAMLSRPCVYDDFLVEAKKVLTAERREKLRRLLEFRFVRHSRYNLPKKRLEMIERQVQYRAQMLLR